MEQTQSVGSKDDDIKVQETNQEDEKVTPD